MTKQEQKIIDLALSFPCLRYVVEYGSLTLTPWDPGELRQWSETASTGERHAAEFVLSVWNPYHPFNLHVALANWDADNRAAFSAWAQSPWWC